MTTQSPAEAEGDSRLKEALADILNRMADAWENDLPMFRSRIQQNIIKTVVHDLRSTARNNVWRAAAPSPAVGGEEEHDMRLSLEAMRDCAQEGGQFRKALVWALAQAARIKALEDWERLCAADMDRLVGQVDALTAERDVLREAAQGLLSSMVDYYTARNGRRVGVAGDDGEKCWIVTTDAIVALRSALRPATSQEGGGQ